MSVSNDSVKMHLPRASPGLNEGKDSFANKSGCCQVQEKTNSSLTLSFSAPAFSLSFAAGHEFYNASHEVLHSCLKPTKTDFA